MTMEDAHITNVNIGNDIALFAVFDGHGGPEVAKFCERYFLEELLKNKNFIAGSYKLALEENFLKMDEILLSEQGPELLKPFKPEPDATLSLAGCTANVALITKTQIYIANAGDSRTVLYKNDRSIVPLSTDHKPDLEAEKARITNAGGYVSEGRVNDNLNLSRAIGDLEYKKNQNLKQTEQLIVSFPEIVCKDLANDVNYLLMGCDGIWETVKLQDMCEFVERSIEKASLQKLQETAEELLDKVIAKDTSEGTGCDNMTTIIIQIKHAT